MNYFHKVCAGDYEMQIILEDRKLLILCQKMKNSVAIKVQIFTW